MSHTDARGVRAGAAPLNALTLVMAVVALPPLAELEVLWTALQSRTDAGFFLTWEWVCAWLETLPADIEAQLLMARRVDGAIVGLGILVPGRLRLLKRLDVGCWYLNTAGDPALDGGMAEYNGFLVDAHAAERVRREMLQYVLERKRPHRLSIRHAAPEYQDFVDNPPPRVLARAERHRSYMVSLQRVRESKGGYVAMLSSNTRSQMRRSLRAYEELGKVQLDVADSVPQALEFLEALRALHAQAWEERDGHSHFAESPVAHEFHARLVRLAFPKGAIQLVRVRAGDAVIGYLYNFVHRGQVCFYQSGFNRNVMPSHERPGVVCHAKAIELNAALGRDWYDFLAGDYRYKASLSTHCRFQWSGHFQRATPLDLMDARLRRWWNARRAPALSAEPDDTDFSRLEVIHA